MTGPRRLILLGATGSIGTSTLDVVRHLRTVPGETFDVVGLAAGRNLSQLVAAATEFGVDHLALAEADHADDVPFAGTLHVGADAATALVKAVARPGDLLVAAVVGAAGIDAVLAGIEAGCDIALANKETLVAAGSLVMPRVAEAGVKLYPVDSEHSAIFQCLHGTGHPEEIRRLVITASGGPFRGRPAEEIRNATPDQALAHPTWTMGRKITIDSASMMNKALEVIEAHWLFDLPAEQIEVIVHPQSMVHSFVEYLDGSVVCQMGPPDMKTPIQVALTWPRRVEGCGRRMDWPGFSSLAFETLDHEIFPAVSLAWEVIRKGGTAGAIFNAANEVAVEHFLDHRIRFGDIVALVAAAVSQLPIVPITSLEDVQRADEAARTFVRRRIETNQTTPSGVVMDTGEHL